MKIFKKAAGILGLLWVALFVITAPFSIVEVWGTDDFISATFAIAFIISLGVIATYWGFKKPKASKPEVVQPKAVRPKVVQAKNSESNQIISKLKATGESLVNLLKAEFPEVIKLIKVKLNKSQSDEEEIDNVKMKKEVKVLSLISLGIFISMFMFAFISSTLSYQTYKDDPSFIHGKEVGANTRSLVAQYGTENQFTVYERAEESVERFIKKNLLEQDEVKVFKKGFVHGYNEQDRIIDKLDNMF